MRITVFNDTSQDWSIHTGSTQGADGESSIPKGGIVTFEGPDKSELFVKVWNDVVMVRFKEREENALNHPFASAQSALFKATWRQLLKPVDRPYVDSKTGLSRL